MHFWRKQKYKNFSETFVSSFYEDDKFSNKSHGFLLKVKILPAKAKHSLVPDRSKHFLCFGVLPVKYRDVYSQIFIDVSPGNRRQASSENRTQGGKPTLSESSKKYNS